MRMLLSLLLAAGFAVADEARAGGASPDCAVEGGTLLSWPSADPVWEMCWLTPNDSSGPRGSGLELRAVHYRGILVAKRIHSPMLFAEYRSSTCYRDWKDQSTPILAHTGTHNQLGVPPDLSRLATTSCSVSDHPTQSYGICPFGEPTGGGFACTAANAVVIEDLGDHVRINSQYRADWYMYDSRISFFDDGAIEPVFGFGNHNGTFNSTTHWHHNYWRFDFDIDGAAGNVVSINDVDQSNEFHDLRGAVGSTTWEVRNAGTGRGFRLTPGANDYTIPTNESGRGFHLVDFMATLYKPNEYGDNPNYSLGDCGMNEDALVNNEALANQDVVLWYRVAVRDTTANDWPPGCSGGSCVPQNSMICKSAGPRLEPFGDWGGGPAEEADLDIAVVDSPDPVQAGNQLGFAVTVSNAGPQSVDQAQIQLELPAELSYLSGRWMKGGGDWSCSAAGATVTCDYTGAAIAAGASATTLQVDTLVDAGAAAGTIDTLASVSSTQWTDPQSANNVATATTTIEAGTVDLIFAHDFECAKGVPGCDVVDPDIVVVEDVNFSPSNDFTGGSINWLTEETCACDTAPFMFNIWGNGGTMAFFFPVQTPADSFGGVTDGTNYSVLASGATIGPASTFAAGTAATLTANWRPAGGTTGYLGFRFFNTTTNEVNFGYARIQTGGTTGYPVTILDYAYNQAGDPITIP